MKYLHIIYFAFIIAMFASCEPNIPDPDTDAVFKSIKKVYTLNEDGTVNYQYQHRLKYLTHYSFNRAYGESFIVYNPNEQQLKINKAVTTMKDGKIVPSPDNAFNEVLPRFAAGAPAYNHLREMVVTHTGLELGCVVDFDYEVSSNKGYVPFLNEVITLSGNSPIQKLEIVVKIPENQELNYKLVNTVVEPSIKTKKGYKVYTWKFTQLAGNPHHYNQPHGKGYLPHLVFSTKSVDEAMQQVNFEGNITDEIKSFATEKTKDIENDFKKVLELQKIVANDINYFKIPFNHADYKVRSLEEVWKSNGATRIEKAILLNSMLNTISIPSELVFTIPKNMYAAEIGLSQNYGHVYVKAVIDDEQIIITPVSSKRTNNLIYSLAENVLINTKGETIDVSEILPTEENKVIFSANVKMDKKGIIDGTVGMEVSGATYPYFKMNGNEDYAKDIIGSVIPKKAIKKHELIEWDNKGCKVKADIKCKEFVKEQGNYFFMKLPGSSYGLKGFHLGTLSEKRTSPLELKSAIDEKYEIEIELAKGLNLVNNLMGTTIGNNAGQVTLSTKVDGNTIHITRHLTIPTKMIKPEMYNDFRNLMLVWNKKNFKELVIKKEE